MKYSCNGLKKQKEMRRRVDIVKQMKDFTKETGVTNANVGKARKVICCRRL